MEFMTEAGIEPNMATQYPIDSKAMRKVDGNSEDIVFVIENFGTTHGILTYFAVRFLVKDA